MPNDLNSAAGAEVLSVVIPALNEEEAIGSTIQRCLDAREKVRASGGLADVEIIVVSDGSTDRTEQIARSYSNVAVYAYPDNRGYGAAIKCGFEHASGDLLGFMDADGTCDPVYFGDMCRVLLSEEADIVLGSRMGAESEMPRLRSVGNRFFALLLGMLSNEPISDTASGMRVVRRDALEPLGPLPDGLHYTPAMSARALLSGLRIREIPMSYGERIGQSKLSVLADGKRFLAAILDGVLFYRPARVFFLMFAFFFVLATMVSLSPAEHYMRFGSIEPWMIYRFVLAFLLGSLSAISLGTAAVASRLASLVGVGGQGSFWNKAVEYVFSGNSVFWLVGLLVTVAVLLTLPGIVQYAASGTVSLHWSRVIVSAFALLVAFQTLLTSTLLRIMNYWIRVAEFRSRPLATTS